MRIIHVTDTSIYNYDGISTYINELLETSEAQGDQVLVLTTTPLHKNLVRKINYRGRTKIFKCVRFPGKRNFAIILTFGVNKAISDFNPDIIWIHTVGALGIKAAKIVEGLYPVIYTKHCFEGEMWTTYLKINPYFIWFFNFFAKKLENKILRAAEIVVYHLKDISKIKDDYFFYKFFFIPPPLNSRFFQKRVLKKGLQKKKLTLGFCGRCDTDKGIADTLKGLEIFHQNYKDIEIEFILIGDGPLANILKKKYQFLNITVTGFVNNVIPYLDKLDAFIISSKNETISLSSLEAYARGLTIFSYPIGFLSENTGLLKNFYLFENPHQLSDLIYQVLIKNDTSSEGNRLNNIRSLVISYNELYSMLISRVLFDPNGLTNKILINQEINIPSLKKSIA